MKKKYLFTSILIFFILVIIIAVLIFLNYNNKQNILMEENNQVNALYAIYNNFLSSTFPEANIRLDNSTLKNILTSQFFSETNQLKLKQLEKTNDSSILYILSSNYNKDQKILTLYLKDEEGNIHASKEYNLEIKNNNISYTSSQITQISE